MTVCRAHHAQYHFNARRFLGLLPVGLTFHIRSKMYPEIVHHARVDFDHIYADGIGCVRPDNLFNPAMEWGVDEFSTPEELYNYVPRS